jgi:spore coat protein T
MSFQEFNPEEPFSPQDQQEVGSELVQEEERQFPTQAGYHPPYPYPRPRPRPYYPYYPPYFYPFPYPYYPYPYYPYPYYPGYGYGGGY